MKFSILILLSGSIVFTSFGQVGSITITVKNSITSFDISSDNKYIFIRDENQYSYFFDIQKRGFVSGSEIKNLPTSSINQSNGLSAKKYISRPTEVKKFKVRIESDNIIIEDKEGSIVNSFKLRHEDYDFGYSNTGKYFLIIQKDIFYNKSDAGIKVINLETGKIIMDANSYVKNKKVNETVNGGIPSPFSMDVHNQSEVKYDGTSSKTAGDTTYWNYTKKNGTKGLYKQFTAFAPEFAEFNMMETRIVVTGSERFKVINLETGSRIFEKKDGCKLAKFTRDGKIIVSAHGNMLSFYDSFNGNLLFTSLDRNNTKGYADSNPNAGSFDAILEMAEKGLPKSTSQRTKDSINKYLAKYNSLNKNDKEKAAKKMDSVLGNVFDLANSSMYGAYEKMGLIPPKSDKNLENKYIEVREGNYNYKATHLIIGYSEFENYHINSGDIDHTENPIFYSVLNLNTGKLIQNPDWKGSKIKHAMFNRKGNLLLLDYSKSTPLPMYAKSLVEVWDVEKNKTIYPISNSKILSQPEHDCFFSDDDKYLIITNDWHKESELEVEIFNAADGKRIGYSKIPIGYDDNYYTLKLLFLPESNILVKYRNYKRAISIYDLLSGRAILNDFPIFVKAQQSFVTVTYDKNYLYINNSVYMSDESPIIVWDLRKRSFTENFKPFLKLADKSFRIPDKSGSYYIHNTNNGLSIFDKGDSLINTIRNSYPIFAAPDFSFRILDDSLYFITADQYSREFSVIKVEKFKDPKNYKIKKIGKLHYKQSNRITGNNIAKNVFTAVDNGDLNFYSLRNGKSVCKLRMLTETDFIIWNDKNEYMSSTNLLTKRFKGLEKLEIEKNRPDIILQSLGSNDKERISNLVSAREERIGRNNISDEKISKNDQLAYSKPSVSLKAISDSVSSNKRKFTVQLNATDQQNRLAKVWIWVKNSPLWGIGGLDILKQKSKNFDSTITIELSEGNNIIEFAAENVVGVHSTAEYTEITYNPEKEVKPKLFFIGAGISRYNSNKVNDLYYADKDVKDLANLFDSKYPGGVVETFINERATRKNIIAAKNKLITSTVDDIVIFYLSGHGVFDTTSKTWWRFATYGFGNSTAENGLTFEEIESIIDKIPARKKILIIDACRSGELPRKLTVKGRPIETKRTSDENTSLSFLKSGDNIEILDPELEIFNLMFESFSDLSKGSGAHVIVSSKGNQKSGEYPELQHGLLTYFLIKKLTDQENTTTKTPLSVLELRNYIIQETKKYSKGVQQPVSRRENFEFNWTIW